MISSKKWAEERVAELKRRIPLLVEELKGVDVEKVTLFGSMARGDAGLFSDIDIVVIWNNEKPFIARQMELYRRIDTYGAEIFAYTAEEIKRLEEWSTFIRSALTEGIVLYERKGKL